MSKTTKKVEKTTTNAPKLKVVKVKGTNTTVIETTDGLTIAEISRTTDHTTFKKAAGVKAERKSTAKHYKYSGKPLAAGLKGVYGIMIRCAAKYEGTFTKADLGASLERENASKMPGLKNVAWYLPQAKTDGYVVEA